jgi:hypothetical protein
MMSDFREMVENIREDAINNEIIKMTENYFDIGEPTEELLTVALKYNIAYTDVLKRYYDILESE